MEEEKKISNPDKMEEISKGNTDSREQPYGSSGEARQGDFSGGSAEKKESQKHTKKGAPKKRGQKTTKRLLLGLLIKIGAVVAAVWLMFTFVLGFDIHYGNNMHPSVRDGDLIFSFRLQKPYINAAVMYDRDGKTDIGRVIALEGSTVDISDDGELTVNGISPAEEVFYPTYRAADSNVRFPYTVEPGKVFILNDFRTDTNDSRSFGAVDESKLKGTLLLTLRRRGL